MASKSPCSRPGQATWHRTRSMATLAAYSLRAILSHWNLVHQSWLPQPQSCCASTEPASSCGGSPGLESMASSCREFKMVRFLAMPNGTHQVDGSRFDCFWIPVRHAGAEAPPLCLPWSCSRQLQLSAEAVWKRLRRSSTPSIRIARVTASLAGHPAGVGAHEWI